MLDFDEVTAAPLDRVDFAQPAEYLWCGEVQARLLRRTINTYIGRGAREPLAAVREPEWPCLFSSLCVNSASNQKAWFMSVLILDRKFPIMFRPA